MPTRRAASVSTWSSRSRTRHPQQEEVNGHTLGIAFQLTCEQLRHEAIAAVYRGRRFELNLVYSTNGRNCPSTVDRSFRVRTHPTLHYAQVLGLKIDLHEFENPVDPGRLRALQDSFRPPRQMKCLRSVMLSIVDCAATENVSFVIECLVEGFMQNLLPPTRISWFAKDNDLGHEIGDLIARVVAKHFVEPRSPKTRAVRLKTGTFSHDAILDQT